MNIVINMVGWISVISGGAICIAGVLVQIVRFPDSWRSQGVRRPRETPLFMRVIHLVGIELIGIGVILAGVIRFQTSLWWWASSMPVLGSTVLVVWLLLGGPRRRKV
jgi:hypothetical protein